MSKALTPPPDGERFKWLERQNDDFPYYRGEPVAIPGWKWWVVMAAVAIGFLALIYGPFAFRSSVARFVPVILFIAIPLAALVFAAGSGWTAIFRRLRAIDFVWMVVFYLLSLVVTMIVGYIAIKLFTTAANPAGSHLAAASPIDKVFFFLRTAMQLFGEELFSILPFLALLFWLVAKAGLSRKWGIVLAALGTAVIFAAVHLPTYQWNVAQAFVGLVPVRIVLLLPYILTKNIWVSAGTHILNDYIIFGLPLLAGGADGAGG